MSRFEREKYKITSVSIKSNIYDKVKEDAEKNKRRVSPQIEFIIEEYYRMKGIENADKEKRSI